MWSVSHIVLLGRVEWEGGREEGEGRELAIEERGEREGKRELVTSCSSCTDYVFLHKNYRTQSPQLTGHL